MKESKCNKCQHKFHAESVVKNNTSAVRSPICLVTKLPITYAVGKCTHFTEKK